MIRFTTILLISYYLFGNLCLPESDFSALADLPGMYRHCKSTEDKDMTPFDFVTDHLLNIDGVFDKHDNGDEQKPHTPVQVNHQLQQSIFVIHQFSISLTPGVSIKDFSLIYSEDYLALEYTSGIFRPPILS